MDKQILKMVKVALLNKVTHIKDAQAVTDIQKIYHDNSKERT